jgi:hypothetical protein
MVSVSCGRCVDAFLHPGAIRDGLVSNYTAECLDGTGYDFRYVAGMYTVLYERNGEYLIFSNFSNFVN